MFARRSVWRFAGCSAAISSVLAIAAVAAQVPTATTITLMASPNPVGVSLPVTLTATVSPTPPSGTVTFYDRAVILGSAPLVGAVATYKTIALLPGGHRLRARLWPTAGFAKSTSEVVVQEIWSSHETDLDNGTEIHQSGIVDDLNNDGFLDIAGPGADLSTVVVFGTGHGHFSSTPLQIEQGTFGSAAPVPFATADLRGTGFHDLILVDNTAEDGANETLETALFVAFNNGDGSFTKPQFINLPEVGATNIGTVIVADFNRDGKPDILVTADQVQIYLGDGKGGFSFSAGLSGSSAAVADFNGDGVPDVLSWSEARDSWYGSLSSVRLFLGIGNGRFEPATTVAESFCSVAGPCAPVMAVFDFNRDGKEDLIIQESEVTNTILLGNGNGTFTAHSSFPVAGVNIFTYTVADLNGDGKPDLLSSSGRAAGAYFGNGDGTFQPLFEYPALGFGLIHIADFNGDGRLDVLCGDVLFRGIR